MLVLKVIAVLGLLLGVVSLIVELKHKNKRSCAIFSALIVFSVVLFVILIPAEKAIDNYIAARDGQVEESLDLDSETEAAADESMDADAFDLTNLNEDESETVKELGEEIDKAVKPSAQNNDEIQALDEPSENEAPVLDAAQAPDGAQIRENENVVPSPALPPLPDDPLAPTAVAGKNIDDGKINEPIEFNASKSRKKKAKIVSYEWDFGDGSKSSEKTAVHAYEKIGTYTAVLTVVDKDNHAARAVRTIEINRPESKIKFFEKELPAQDDGVFDKQEGKYTKTFTGSHISLETSGYILTSSDCTCEVTAEIEGPGCLVTKSKKLSNGGEGEIRVKASCKGELGEYQWRIERTASPGCICKYGDFELEGVEY